MLHTIVLVPTDNEAGAGTPTPQSIMSPPREYSMTFKFPILQEALAMTAVNSPSVSLASVSAIGFH